MSERRKGHERRTERKKICTGARGEEKRKRARERERGKQMRKKERHVCGRN